MIKIKQFPTNCKDNLYNFNLLLSINRLSELKKGELDVLRLMIFLANGHSSIRYAHSTLTSFASSKGISRSTLQRRLNRLKSLGLIVWRQRWNKSCVYFINPLVQNNPMFRHEIERLSRIQFVISPKFLRSKRPSARFPQRFDHLEELRVKTGDINLTNLVKEAEINPRTLDHDNFLERGRLHCLQFFKKRPERTKAMTTLADSKLLNLVENYIPLTLHGKIKLANYPHNAVYHAYTKIQEVVNKDNPFLYFLKLIELYCTEHHLSRNNMQYYRELQANGIDKADSLFVDEEKFAVIKRKLLDSSLSSSPKKFAPRQQREFELKPESHNFVKLTEPIRGNEWREQQIKEVKEMAKDLPINPFLAILLGNPSSPNPL